MSFGYYLARCIGYFLIMIIFMIIAIVTAKGKGAWIWYAVGAIFQVVPMLGNQKAAMYWIVYFALLIITAILIVKRYNKASASSASSNTDDEQ